jgi:hypothetical protein
MYRVEADSLEDYLDFDPERKSDLVRLHKLMREAAPDLSRYFHKGTPAGDAGMRMQMIGYGRFHYAIKSGKAIAWPVIGIALQKSYISIYIAVTRQDVPIVQAYAGQLGELRMGRNNFSFERFDDLEIAGVSALFAEVADIFAKDPENPVRYKQGQ